MDEIRLATLLSNNLALLLRLLNSSPHSEILPGPGVSWIVSDLDHPLGNIVLANSLAEAQVDDTIQQTQTFYAQRERSCMWEVNAATQPQDLGRHLTEAGFLAMSSVTDMVLKWPWPDMAVNHTLEIEGVQTLEQWRHFHRIVGACFDLEPDLAAWLNDIVSDPGTLPVWQGKLMAYLAYCDGVPVGATQSVLQDDVVGIYNVATLPAYRLRGIARTLIHYQLAAVPGARCAVLQAGPMHMYRKMGFEVGARARRYLWTPPGLYAARPVY